MSSSTCCRVVIDAPRTQAMEWRGTSLAQRREARGERPVAEKKQEKWSEIAQFYNRF